MIIGNVMLYAEHDNNTTIFQASSERKADYAELRVRANELRVDISRLKEELSKKESYMDSLDEQLIRLENRYSELLKERERIADRLDALEKNQ